MSPSDRDGQPGRDRPDRETIGVETHVRNESGEWLVDLAVAFSDGVVRHTVNKYRTEREARIAASWIRRAADRDIEGPSNG